MEKTKNIEVPQEMYDKLMALATEMTTQDMRITAMPHLFQVREEERVYDWGCNGDNHCFIYDGEYECDYEDENDLGDIIKSYCANRDIESPNLQKMDMDDMIEWLEDKGYDRCSWSIRHLYKNSFLTAKACQEHIESNKHHYTNPTDYLNHAFRNPEMELVSEFLCGLVGKKPHR
jgi:hypothetical protein